MKTLRQMLAERRARRAAEKAQRFRDLTYNAEARAAALTEYPDHTKTGMVEVLRSNR